MDRTRFCLLKTRGLVQLLLCAAAAALFGVMVPCAHAHPHLFIEQQLEIVFDDKGLAGIRVRWKFDDMFSSMVIQDFDTNRNGTFEPGEIKDIKENAFAAVADYDYFTFIKINGTAFKVKFVKDFSAVLTHRQLVYEFFIPCHVSAADTVKKVTVASYDPSYYAALSFADEKPVALEKAEKFEVTMSVREDLNTKIYFDMIHPWTLFLEFRKQP
jgi:ABC-type uncharacterized transport system substrate-binding protein